MHYLVLGGGASPEKEVSLRSATAVYDALIEQGLDATLLDPASISEETLNAHIKSADIVLPILHGKGGEDGSIQARCETLHTPYLGSTHAACQLTFNKVAFKKFLDHRGLPTPKWEVVSTDTFTKSTLTAKPFVLKPIEGGSSIDTFIIRSIPFDPAPLFVALETYGEMLIEELIEGTEVTVAILDTEALPVIEIIPPKDQDFDYENKYNGATQELCPPVHVSPETQKRMQALAYAVHQATDCRHLSRTDILLTKEDQPYIIDANTMPGMTSQSLFPKAAAAAGYTWPQLVKRLLSLISK